jgi:putative oxidoreductase
MMSVFPTVQCAARWGLTVTGALAFLPPLLTRLVMGQAFFLTGRGKLENFANTVQFFTNLGIPMPELNAAFVSRLEFYGGIALVLGLLTRVVAAGLASTMVVALATADKQSFLDALRMSGDQGLTDIVPFVYLIFLIWLAISGPGPVSLDALAARWLRLRPADKPVPSGHPEPASA